MSIYLLIFAAILLIGMKKAPKGEFHEDFLSLRISKGIQGFCAVCIVAHHFIQPYYYKGEEKGPFVFLALIGFLFVGIFFFFSGYGLFKSYKTKPNYLNGFLKKRLPVILIPFYIVNTILTIITLATKGTLYNDTNPLVIGLDNIFFRITTFLGITLMNSNTWYIISITMFYIVFYIAFKKSENEDKAFKAMGIFSVTYVIAGLAGGHGLFWMQGHWWYNSSLLFLVGMYVAKNEEKVISYIKNRYAMILTICGVGAVILTVISKMPIMITAYYQHGLIGKLKALICFAFEASATVSFVAFVLILTMKIRFNNKILDFLGTNALEIYIVHRFYLISLNSQYITIPSRVLYLAAVYACTIITAFILHKIDNAIVRIIKSSKSNKVEIYRA